MASPPPTTDALVGRDAELESIRAFLTRSTPGALLLEGEAGIGKTTLVAAAVADATERGWRVLECRPAAAEARLPFAALADALGGAVDEVISALPAPQGTALLGALRRTDADVDRLALSSGALGVLRALAERRPVLLAIDDAQWLDAPSANVVAFAVRRLTDEPVVVVASRREGEALPSAFEAALTAIGVERVRARPLSLGAIGRIIRSRLGLSLHRPSLIRIHEASRGNPFFALELAAALATAEDGEGALPVPETVRELVRRRLVALPEDARGGLLVVAALGHPATDVLALAVEDWQRVLAPVLDAAILEVRSGRIRFAHPLLASGVYGDAAEHERRAVHDMLARVVPDPQQRAWHLAHATARADEDVASTLESAAAGAAVRGAPETAAELAEHAHRLTPHEHSDERTRRALRTATYAWAAGDATRSRRILVDLIGTLAPSPARAAARQLLVKIVDDVPETIDLLNHALDDAAGNAAVEASVLNLLARQRTWAGDFVGGIRDAEAAARRAAEAGSTADLAVALAREAHARVWSGERTPHELLDRAVALERQVGDSIPIGDSPMRFRALCALWDDDLETAWELTTAVDRRAQAASESWRAIVLTTLAEIELRGGSVANATAAIETASEIAGYWGVVHAEGAVLAWAALVDAAAGRVEEARQAATRAVALMRPAGYDSIVRAAERALGFLELSRGAPAAAHAVLEPLLARSGIGHPYAAAAVPDDVEALVELGRVDEAETLLAELAAHVERTGRRRRRVAVARCRALIAAARGDFAAAITDAEDALALCRDGVEPLEHGRTLLVLGEVRRRAKQRGAAREALEAARTLFEEIGTPLWAERARAELGRVGGRRASPEELTPSERRIAELVARGRTNREVAAELFVTVHTVEKALTRAYRKLGVRSRTELARTLAELRISPRKE
jgi:DNA-binding CsgD family transcriptional regulator